MHHRSKKVILAGILAIAGLIASTEIVRAAFITLIANNSDSKVLLSDLLPGGEYEGVEVGDKRFSEFFYNTLPNDDMPVASQVEVFGFQDLNNNWGLSFHGVFQDLPGLGPSDALLRFTVEVTPEALALGWRISDAHLFLGGVGLGSNSFLSVDESFQGLNDTLNAYATTLGGASEQVLFDGVIFGELYTKLRVTKDILAFAGNSSTEPARITVIDQSFSQTLIPEPSTLTILTMLGLGVFSARRRSPTRSDGS